MDENVKNDAKQVMLVQNADDGRLQAVTGVDQDGNIQTADPTDQNVASLLNVNTQDSALEAFFKKFMEQAQNPVHTGIFVMTENALNKLIRIDFDPEILENYRIDPSERLQTQEQRQFEPLDVTKIDLADMEKKGIRMEDIEPHLKAMSYGHKSNGLVEMTPELENGMRVSTKGRVSLEEQADGSLRVVPHYWQERPDLDAPFHGVLLDEEAKTNLMNTRHAGKVIDLELEPGKLTPCYVSIDKWTNTLEPMPVSLLEKRARIKEADLSEGKQMDFYGGGKVLLEGYTTARVISGMPISKSTRPNVTIPLPTTVWIATATPRRTRRFTARRPPRKTDGRKLRPPNDSPRSRFTGQSSKPPCPKRLMTSGRKR